MAAHKISSSLEGGWSKPKQKDQRGQWSDRCNQDKNSAPKVRSNNNALERTTVFPLGARLSRSDMLRESMMMRRSFLPLDTPLHNKIRTKIMKSPMEAAMSRMTSLMTWMDGNSLAEPPHLLLQEVNAMRTQFL